MIGINLLHRKMDVCSCRFIGISLLLIIFSSNLFSATISKKTIKPAGQGGDYTSLAAWQTGELGAGRGNLVARDEIALAEIDGNWTNPDTGPVVITGWTTDANHYVKIYTTPAARHSGVWDKIREANGHTSTGKIALTR